MNLAMLKPGEQGRITGIGAVGPLRRRLMDMGVLVGEGITVVKVAPLGDPIEVTIKSYRLTLRKQEAAGIAVEVPAMSTATMPVETAPESGAGPRLSRPGEKRTITVAVAGNPNAGKSTLINAISGSRLHVGNWPGVTVEKKEANFDFAGASIRLVDLPGTYSLSPYTQEEIIARDYLVHEKPDLVINVVDATNLERNLYLTMQLLELGLPLVMALNIYDEAEAKGYRIDTEGLERMLGVPVVPTAATKSRGVRELLDKVVQASRAAHTSRPTPTRYAAEIENAIDEVSTIHPRAVSGTGGRLPPAVARLQGDGGGQGGRPRSAGRSGGACRRCAQPPAPRPWRRHRVADDGRPVLSRVRPHPRSPAEAGTSSG